MDLSKLEQLGKICKNRYAAILIASKQARKLNLQIPAEEVQTGKKEKITVRAIDDLLKNRINYEYTRTKSRSIA